MNLITLDSVIRSYIIERGMIWHDYFRLLTIGIQGVKNLAEDINIGSNIKAEYIDITSTGRLQIPPKATQIIGLYVENGDKLLPMSLSDDINPVVLKDSSGNPERRNAESGTIYYSADYYFDSITNDKGEYSGRNFGVPAVQPYKFRIIESEIQIDVRIKASCVLVIYTTNGLVASDITVIHPLAEQAIKAYLDSKWTERGQKKGIWEKRNEETLFYNEKRLLKGRINGLTWAQYLSTIREFQVATAKY